MKVWQTSNLRRLRLGEEKKKKEERKKKERRKKEERKKKEEERNHRVKIQRSALFHRATTDND